ncbi:MAG TPA: alpha/beta fold hydrolase [Solirubrobacteraceae bacterium]|nr:alpha/beta fold hydrolase [Solirubrobacteraceae bacterium]
MSTQAPGAGRVQTAAPFQQPSDAGALSRWMPMDWRSHQRWVMVDGRPMNVIELGEGEPPIVFVHGLAGSWPNWLQQLPAFADTHRVLAMDLPGFGRSPMPAQKISIRGYARALDGLLAARGIAAATVVGNSMGGFIACELAIACPQRVERLALVSAAGLSTHNEPAAARVLPAMRRARRVTAGASEWLASNADAIARRPRLRREALRLVAAHPERLAAALAAEQLRGAGKPGFFDALEAVLTYHVRERLPEIACPTLIAWGDRDRLISVRDADVFEALIPNARKVIFNDTGHVAMLERPAQFNALLAQFLAE